MAHATRTQTHTLSEAARKAKARTTWFNWHVNRGRISSAPTAKELRSLSNRRIF